NLKDSTLADKTVRQAMAYAIDREKVAKVAEYGYQPAANQSGIVTPTYKDWLDTSQQGYTHDATKAESLLTTAGYHKGSDGIFVSPSGQRLSFGIINIGDYSDWVAAVHEIETDLKSVGIEIKAQNVSRDDYDNRLYNGRFQLA